MYMKCSPSAEEEPKYALCELSRSVGTALIAGCLESGPSQHQRAMSDPAAPSHRTFHPLWTAGWLLPWVPAHFPSFSETPVWGVSRGLCPRIQTCCGSAGPCAPYSAEQEATVACEQR